MTDCAEHRSFLAAVADGELEQVPEATLEHLRDCLDCREEIEIHRVLGAKVRTAVAEPHQASTPRRGWGRRAALKAAGAALAVLLASSAAFTYLASRPDPVLAAAAAAGQPPQFRSSDSGEIGSWCRQAAERPMPEVDLAPLSLVGARMDRSAGTGIVTVFYLTPDGRPVAISWLDSSSAPVPKQSVTSREVNGQPVLITISPHGTVVISGAAPISVLWRVAAQVEDGSST